MSYRTSSTRIRIGSMSESRDGNSTGPPERTGDCATRTSPIVGGVFALERPNGLLVGTSILASWTGHAEAIHLFHNARSAIRYVISALQPRRLWLPAFMWPRVHECVGGLAVTVEHYRSDELLVPDARFLRDVLLPGDLVLGVNYFGRPAHPDWMELVDHLDGVTWLEDCVPSLDTGGRHYGDVRVYSPRKLLGAPDGGVLVDQRGILPTPNLVKLNTERFIAPYLMRAADPEGTNRKAWFDAFRSAEAEMIASDAAMSEKTKAILEQTDLAPMVERRIENYLFLFRALKDLALFPDPPSGWAPFGFPLLTERHEALWDHLRRHSIFAPRIWRRLTSPQQKFPVEHALSAALITIPCDQRYDLEDMQRVVSVVREVCP